METTNGVARSVAASGGLPRAMAQHPLFSYYFMAYAFSWTMLILYILSVWGFLPDYFVIAFVLNPFVGPALAGILMTRITEGKAGLQRLRQRCLQVRAGWQWYLFILLGIPALFWLGIAVLPGALASFKGFPPAYLVTYLVNFVVIFFLGGPLGEEIGWRGFALPRMQSRFGALRGTLLLGILWVGWHLPHYLTPAQRGGPGVSFTFLLGNFAIFFVMVMALNVIFAWVFNHTRGSVFIAILLHASVNSFGIVPQLFGAPIVTHTDWFVLIGALVPAVLILILTRGRLDYRSGQEQPQPAL